MLSDEEKEALGQCRLLLNGDITLHIIDDDGGTAYCGIVNKEYNKDLETVLNLIEKQSKEIEELKEDRKKYAEEYIHNNPWLYKQLNENYILRVESEQKERKAYIKGTNDAHELCNKKWKDKIKAKIEPKLKELDEQINEEWKKYGNSKELQDMEDMYNFLQSLLEKK